MDIWVAVSPQVDQLTEVMPNFWRAVYIWWSNWEPSICSLGRVQTHPTNNAIFGKITIWKVNWPRNDIINHLNISKQSVIQLFVHSRSFFILILVKFYCFTCSFVFNTYAKSVVLKLTTIYSEHSCWFLLNYLSQNILVSVPQSPTHLSLDA